MDLKSFSLVFGVVLLLAVTGTLSQDVQPRLVNETKIVGGNASSPYQIPYQVSLRYTDGRAHFCGGTLVTNRHVLTAAHCMKPTSTRTLRPDEVLAFLGSLYLNSGGFLSSVIVIHIHKGHSLNTNVDDIAILKLIVPLNLTAAIFTIPLRTTFTSTGTNCTVSGWGSMYYGGPVTNNLMYVNVPIYDYNTCRAAYGSNTIKDKMICAGFYNGGKDACQGDSGGPLVCGGYVVGIVSFGAGCASPIFPGVYTEVYKYNSWIKDAINASLPTSTLSLCLLVIAQFVYFLLK